MDKKTALKFCKYYKGEDTNPYPLSVPRYLWRVEEEWTEEMRLENVVTERLSKALHLYFTDGYADFEKFDDTPITLKAMIYSLFGHFAEGCFTKKEFADFYAKWKQCKF